LSRLFRVKGSDLRRSDKIKRCDEDDGDDGGQPDLASKQNSKLPSREHQEAEHRQQVNCVETGQRGTRGCDGRDENVSPSEFVEVSHKVKRRDEPERQRRHLQHHLARVGEYERREREQQHRGGRDSCAVRSRHEPKQVHAGQHREQRNDESRDEERRAEHTHGHAFDQVEHRRPDQQAQRRILHVVGLGIALHIGDGLIGQQIAEENAGHDVPVFVTVEHRFFRLRNRQVGSQHDDQRRQDPPPRTRRGVCPFAGLTLCCHFVIPGWIIGSQIHAEVAARRKPSGDCALLRGRPDGLRRSATTLRLAK